MIHAGGCHCGAIRFAFASVQPLAPRACQCSFCRKHGARTVTDPNGAARLMPGPETTRYRFGYGLTEFLICGRCGVYIGALASLDGRRFVTLNLNAFDDPRPDLRAVPVSYQGETVSARAARRRASWTPVSTERPSTD